MVRFPWCSGIMKRWWQKKRAVATLRFPLIVFFGWILADVCRLLGTIYLSENSECTPELFPVHYTPGILKEEINIPASFFVVAVMTANRYLGSRAKVVHETYSKDVEENGGQVIFFTSEDSDLSPVLATMKVIRLKHVDDSYPPQRKSFEMLKFLSRLDAEWFIRLDDDAYLRPDALEKFLRSMNSSEALFIGQSGQGSKDELGKLSLQEDMNYCMGGPGIILSRELLKRLAPHIPKCLLQMQTLHEDVELGRCVRTHLGVPCTWSYEMRTLMQHTYSQQEKEVKRKGIHRVITLHPIKDADFFYRIHKFIVQLRIQDVTQSMMLKRRRLRWLAGNGSLESSLFVSSNVAPFDFVTLNRAILPNGAVLGMSGDRKEALLDEIYAVMDQLRSLDKQRGRFISFRKFWYGYSRVNPGRGVEYVLDLYLQYAKFRGRIIKVRARRHGYMQNPFTGIQVWSEEGERRPVLNLIVPVEGRFEALKRFLESVTSACVEAVRCRLVVVLYPSHESDESRFLLKTFQTRHPVVETVILDPPSDTFSRGPALQFGLEEACQENDLLLLIDVDMIFTSDALERVHHFTRQGESVYYPIVFSEFKKDVASADHFFISSGGNGFWRIFGFGIVALFASDLFSVGGFNLSIQGWGKEDVDLVNRVVQNLTVVRMPDPGFVHAYHSPECLSSAQTREHVLMCQGTSSRLLGPLTNLTEYMFQNHFDLFTDFSPSR